MDFKLIIITSAVTSALVSGIIAFIINLINQKQENERYNLNIAMKITEIKHKQIDMLIKAHEQDKTPLPHLVFNDPATVFSDYLKAIKEIRKKGIWAKGEKMKNDK